MFFFYTVREDRVSTFMPPLLSEVDDLNHESSKRQEVLRYPMYYLEYIFELYNLKILNIK